MFGASFRNRARNATTRFVGAKEGNIAVTFAIALVPILGFVGVAIDYTRANAARSSMQAALDSTALMLSKDLSQGTITTSQITAKAQAYFTALYTNKDATVVEPVTATYTASSSLGSSIQVNASGSVKSDFLRLKEFNFPTINFSGSSTAAWGNVRMRVAMALDNTGSMADDGKMPAMKKAAKDLVDQLSALAKTKGDIYISVIPFAKDVNVDDSNYTQSWIDWTDWDAANGTCNSTNWWGGCTSWTPANHNKWTGCVTDRDQDYDTKNTAPTNSSTRFPAEEYVSGNDKYCKKNNNPYLQPILPLSYDWTAIKTRIGDMEPTGNTNQSIGMAWAWMSLTQSDPLNAPPKDKDYEYKDVIILLSDGLNTQNRWYSNAAQIDARQKTLCENINAKDPITKIPLYTVYTIQVNTGKPADAESTVLKNCATDASKFYTITSVDQTAAVFSSIGTSLSKLRVAK